MYRYDDLFFSYLEAGSGRSAQTVVPLLHSNLRPRSVADFGCGRGAWLEAWLAVGIEDVLGVDGPYVPSDKLLIRPEAFRAEDLTSALDLGRRFDLVTSFEVGEHLPAAASRAFIDNLCRHAPVVAFSAAVPGQGGEHHINEQPYAFWRELFAANGYRCFDFIRPRIKDSRAVEPWYRYNALLFVADDAVPRLPEPVRATRIADGAPVPDVSPVVFRMRKEILRRLSTTHVDRLAVLKHRLMVAAAGVRGRALVGIAR
jgi:hypothetical protein